MVSAVGRDDGCGRCDIAFALLGRESGGRHSVVLSGWRCGGGVGRATRKESGGGGGGVVTSGRAAGSCAMLLAGHWLHLQGGRMEASGVPLHCWGGVGIVRELVAGRKGGSVMGMLVSALGPVSSLSVEMAFVVDGRGGTSVAPTAKRRGTKRGWDCK
jgi:hypothetical protein